METEAHPAALPWNAAASPSSVMTFSGSSSTSAPGRSLYRRRGGVVVAVLGSANCSACSGSIRPEPKLLSRSPGASRFALTVLKRRTALTRLLDNGRLCMSNNAAERELRAVAVGRRNWTFTGSGGRRAAGIRQAQRHFAARRIIVAANP